jgi:predicted RNase H-like nuclease (RuvC/YqgF family)
MVQTLLAHQDTKRPRADDQDWAPGAKDQPFDPEEMELFKERVKREVARATGQAVRAMEEAKRAAKQAVSNYLRAEQSAPDSDLAPSPADKQLEALRIKREALQRAMQELDRHIQRLERDRERSAEDPQRRNETNAGQPKPEAPLSETPATK